MLWTQLLQALVLVAEVVMERVEVLVLVLGLALEQVRALELELVLEPVQ